MKGRGLDHLILELILLLEKLIGFWIIHQSVLIEMDNLLNRPFNKEK